MSGRNYKADQGRELTLEEAQAAFLFGIEHEKWKNKPAMTGTSSAFSGSLHIKITDEREEEIEHSNSEG